MLTFCPTQLYNVRKYRPPETSAQMKAPFAPIETLTAQWRAFSGQGVELDPKIAYKAGTGSREENILAFYAQEAPRDHAVKKARRHFTREVIITDAGLSQRHVLRTGPDAQVPGVRCDPHERLQSMRDFVPCQSEIFVPPLFTRTYQRSLLEFSKVETCCLKRHACFVRQFTGCQCSVSYQSCQHVCPCRIANQTGNESNVRSLFHTSMLVEPFASGNGVILTRREEEWPC